MDPKVIVDFPMDEVVARLDQESSPDRAELAQALSRVVEWLAAPDIPYRGRRRLQIIALRTITLAYALRPDLVGGSLRQFAKASGVSKSAISQHSVQVVRRFGLVSSYQHSVGIHSRGPSPAARQTRR